MLAGVVMIMHVRILGVAVLMGMLVDVFVNMGVGVFVGVDLAPVSVLMAVSMDMLVGMQMPVFVFADHNEILSSKKLQVFHKPVVLIIMFKLTTVNNHQSISEKGWASRPPAAPSGA